MRSRASVRSVAPSRESVKQRGVHTKQIPDPTKTLLVWEPFWQDSKGEVMRKSISYGLLAGFVVLAAGLVLVLNRPAIDQPVGGMTEPASLDGQAAQIINPTPTNSIGEGLLETETGEKEGWNPDPRVGLQATDPKTVSLTSGEIQLVEFFAFW